VHTYKKRTPSTVSNQPSSCLFISSIDLGSYYLFGKTRGFRISRVLLFEFLFTHSLLTVAVVQSSATNLTNTKLHATMQGA